MQAPQFVDGLESLKLLALIQAFPDVFRPLFVTPEEITAECVIDIMEKVENREPTDINPEKKQAAWDMLLRYLRGN